VAHSIELVSNAIRRTAAGCLKEIEVLLLRVILLCRPLALLSLAARDQEIEVGTSPICDTQEQVERFVTLYDGDAHRTVNNVNAVEHDPTACAVSTTAYVRGRQLATARNKHTTFQVVPSLFLALSRRTASKP
jgi:hypothetical protein